MAYLITEALYNNEIRNFIVESGKVISSRQQINHLNLLKMSCQSFDMIPGKVHYSSTYFLVESLAERKEFFLNLQKKGYTSLVVSYKVPYGEKLAYYLKKAKHELINSPLDYIIGITVDKTELTPKLIRQCIRFKVPFIMVEMNYRGFENIISWEWIRNQNFPTPLCILPSWLDEEKHQKLRIKREDDWQRFAWSLSIHTTFPLGDTLTVEQLKALGIYPQKGIIHSGSDLDYNLYYHSRDSQLDVQTFSHYYSDNPNIVILRGKVMKINDTIYFRPGFGQHVNPVVPGRFSSLLK